MKLLGQSEAVAIRQPDVDEDGVWSQLNRARQRLGDRGRLANHFMTPSGQNSRDEVTERSVVVDD